MIEAKRKFFFRNECLFEAGDRVETGNHCTGIVVRVDRDEIGVFIVVKLDVMLGEFAYNPSELEKLQ
ncbi:hypothetical protein JCM17380_42010 [Desulfosporosinus burensis]